MKYRSFGQSRSVYIALPAEKICRAGQREVIFLLIHTVKSGETLNSIASMHGANVYDVANYNLIEPPYYITAGQNIIILNVKEVYSAVSGDSLYLIARRFNTDVKTLLRNNPHLIGKSFIEPGMRIIISYDEEKRGRLTLNGYAYPNISDFNLNYALKYLTYLTPFTYSLNSDGTLSELDDSALLDSASQNGVKSLISVSSLAPSGGFSSQISDDVLNSPSARRRLINEISLRMGPYDGIDMDLEYIYAKNAEAYASFLGELSGTFNPDGKPVVAAAAPKTRSNQPGILYEGHNYRLMGYNANKVFLMTYEWGYTYGPPMAVAPIPNVRRVVSYAVSEIEPDKLWLGIPNYGYNWTLPFVQGSSRARTVSNMSAVSLAARYGVPIMFDETAKAPYFNYTDESGLRHEVWFEDAKSILAKLDLLTEFDLSGIGIWNIMYSFPAMYTLINVLYDI